MHLILCAVSLFCMATATAFPTDHPSKTTFLYIRHGEVPGNNPNPLTYIYTGCGTDGSLTEKGQNQAKACALKIASLQKRGAIEKVAALYASDLKRAQETAAPIGKALGIEVHSTPNLREIDWGIADGQLVQKMAEEWRALEKHIKQQYPERKIRWDHLPVFPGAETYNALLNRTLAELKTIAESHPGETVLIVGHGRVLKTLIAEARDSEKNIPYPPNCGIAEFTYSPEEGLSFVKVFEES